MQTIKWFGGFISHYWFDALAALVIIAVVGFVLAVAGTFLFRGVRAASRSASQARIPQVNWGPVLLVIAATVAVLAFGYHFWGFLLEFIALSLVYATIALILLWLISGNWGNNNVSFRIWRIQTQINEIYAETDRIRRPGTPDARRAANDVEITARPLERFWKYVSNNNTYFYVLVAATFLTFVIALFNWGPALLLPENTPTLVGWQKDAVNTVNFLFYGNSGDKLISQPEDTLPWATGTWFWWEACVLYGIIAFGYSFYAFHDELSTIFREARQSFEKRREAIAKRQREEWELRKSTIEAENEQRRKATKKGQPPPVPTAVPAPPPSQLNASQFLQIAGIGGLMDILFEVVEAFMRRRRQSA